MNIMHQAKAHMRAGAIIVGMLLIAAPHATLAENSSATTSQANQTITMYKSPNCDCCGAWAKHMEQAGFTVVEKKRDDMDVIKSKYGVSERLASCHTALIDGYVIEGHVPAEDVIRLLKERPAVVGLTAPGMPMQSPGMQKPGLPPRAYDVLSFTTNGETHVYHHYPQ
jgi:hypothetical protein